MKNLDACFVCLIDSENRSFADDKIKLPIWSSDESPEKKPVNLNEQDKSTLHYIFQHPNQNGVILSKKGLAPSSEVGKPSNESINSLLEVESSKFEYFDFDESEYYGDFQESELRKKSIESSKHFMGGNNVNIFIQGRTRKTFRRNFCKFSDESLGYCLIKYILQKKEKKKRLFISTNMQTVRKTASMSFFSLNKETAEKGIFDSFLTYPHGRRLPMMEVQSTKEVKELFAKLKAPSGKKENEISHLKLLLLVSSKKKGIFENKELQSELNIFMFQTYEEEVALEGMLKGLSSPYSTPTKENKERSPDKYPTTRLGVLLSSAIKKRSKLLFFTFVKPWANYYGSNREALQLSSGIRRMVFPELKNEKEIFETRDNDPSFASEKKSKSLSGLSKFTIKPQNTENSKGGEVSLLKVLDRLRTENTPVTTDRIEVSGRRPVETNLKKDFREDLVQDHRDYTNMSSKKGLQTPQFERERSSHAGSGSKENFSSMKKRRVVHSTEGKLSGSDSDADAKEIKQFRLRVEKLFQETSDFFAELKKCHKDTINYFRDPTSGQDELRRNYKVLLDATEEFKDLLKKYSDKNLDLEEELFRKREQLRKYKIKFDRQAGREIPESERKDKYMMTGDMFEKKERELENEILKLRNVVDNYKNQLFASENEMVKSIAREKSYQRNIANLENELQRKIEVSSVGGNKPKNLMKYASEFIIGETGKEKIERTLLNQRLKSLDFQQEQAENRVKSKAVLEFQKYEQLINNIEKEKEMLSIELSKARKKIVDKAQKLEDLEKKIQALLSKNEDLDDELSRDRDELRDAEIQISSLTAQLTHEEEANMELREKIKDLESKILISKKDHMTFEIESNQKKDAERKFTMVNKEIIDQKKLSEKALDELRIIRGRVSDVEYLNSNLTKEREQMMEMIEILQEETKLLKNDCEEKSRKIQELVERRLDTEQELKIKSSLLEVSEKANSNSEARITGLEKERAGLFSEIKSLKECLYKEGQELRGRVRDLEMERVLLENEKNRAQSILEEYAKENELLAMENKNFNNQASKVKAENMRAFDLMERMENQRKDKEQEMDKERIMLKTNLEKLKIERETEKEHRKEKDSKMKALGEIQSLIYNHRNKIRILNN